MTKTIVLPNRVEELGLVDPYDPSRVKNTTYDISVGAIYPTGVNFNEAAGKLNSYMLQPSEIVQVMSLERVQLPVNVTGLTTLVTSLTKQGLLCLNVGILDPGYNGYVSATLINFSNQPRKISLNDRMFRVLFLSHEALESVTSDEISKTDYGNILKDRSRDEYSASFLNIEEVLKIGDKQAWALVRRSITVYWLPWLVLFVTWLGILISFL